MFTSDKKIKFTDDNVDHVFIVNQILPNKKQYNRQLIFYIKLTN